MMVKSIFTEIGAALSSSLGRGSVRRLSAVVKRTATADPLPYKVKGRPTAPRHDL